MSENYFSWVGVEQSFDINREQLAKNHLYLQKALHPDRFVNDTPRQKLEAVNRMAMVNDAYQTLADPYRRGEYLLQLAGWQKPDENITIKSPALLMEQLELRERLAEIKLIDDPFDELEKFQQEIETLISLQVKQIADLFAQNHSEQSESEQVQNTIFAALVRLKFLHKLLDEIRLFEDQLDE